MSLNLSKLFNKPVGFYLALFFLIAVILYKPEKNEGFLSPGEYPRDINYPLLYEDYPLKKKHYKQVSGNNYSNNYKYYPIYPADSLNINNVRYWQTPDNGECSRAEFCDVLYDKKQLNEDKLHSPQPAWGEQRVNYYAGNTLQ